MKKINKFLCAVITISLSCGPISLNVSLTLGSKTPENPSTQNL